MRSRLLVLDDSGKPDAKHPSGAVVIAGLSIDSLDYPTFSRRLLGAKGKFYPHRGPPQGWEIKSTDYIKPNPWKRSKNRQFVYEIARIADDLSATIYAATIVKAHMKHPMTLSTTMPLQLQCLVEHFAAECQAINAMGIVVADWSSHQFDQHASRCVASFVASRKLAIHPCVYYASSHGNEAVQAADLISGVRRRAAEGDAQLAALDTHLAAIRPAGTLGLTVTGRAYSNYINVF